MRRTHSILAALTLAAVAAAQAPVWTLAAPATSPSQRRAGAMAWDATANRLLMFGGVTPTPSIVVNETWTFNGQWTQLTSATSNARWGHQLVRNSQTNRLLMFGGRSPTISGLANDTVEWTGTAWTTIATTGAPSQRYLYGLAYDSVRNVHVLFGGRGFTATNAETWEYSSTPTPTWTLRTLVNNPPAREEMAMVYDTSLQRVVLFGGFNRDTNTVLGDTWLYDGSGWLEVTPADPAASPSPRYRAQTVYDSFRSRVVMYGGFNGTTIAQQTYEFTGSAWNLVTTTSAVAPVNATEAMHGYDPVRRRFVQFGGFGASGFSNATYEFNGATTGFFSTFGSACATSVGEPTITSNTPRIGQSWDVTFANLPVDCEFVVGVLGLTKPLPVDLGFLGLNGCNLLVATDLLSTLVTVPQPDDTSSATLNFPIPAQATLVGVTGYVQGILADIVDPDLVFPGASAGGRAVIGS